MEAKPKRMRVRETPLTDQQKALAVQWFPWACKLAIRSCAKLGVPNLYRDDVMSEAWSCLIDSARAFDPSRGVQFNTYIGTSIPLRLCREFHKNKGRALAGERMKVEDFGTAALATVLDHGTSRSAAAKFDVPFRTASEQPEIEVLGCTATEIEALLPILSDRERDVIQSFFGYRTLKWTLEELGRKYNVTKARTGQIKRSALKKLLKAHNDRQKNLLKKSA